MNIRAPGVFAKGRAFSRHLSHLVVKSCFVFVISTLLRYVPTVALGISEVMDIQVGIWRVIGLSTTDSTFDHPSVRTGLFHICTVLGMSGE